MSMAERFNSLCEELGFEKLRYHSSGDLKEKHISYIEGYIEYLEGYQRDLFSAIRKSKESEANTTAGFEQTAQQLKSHISNLKAEIEELVSRPKPRLSECLKRIQHIESNAGSNGTDASELQFTFEHHLDVASRYFNQVYAGEFDANHLITSPNYMDELILNDDEAVYLRGFIYLVAQGAYEQETQPQILMDYVKNRPWMPDEERLKIFSRANFLHTNAHMHHRFETYVAWINQAKGNEHFIDPMSNGHHMTYLQFPNDDFNAQLIRKQKQDVSGRAYTDEEAARYCTSLKSKPLLTADFSARLLLRITDAFIKNQSQGNRVHTQDLLTDYSVLLDLHEDAALAANVPLRR